MSSTLIPSYTDAVLAFDFTDAKEATTATPAPLAKEVQDFTLRTLKLFDKSGADYLVLFGLGSGEQALALDAALPDCARLIVCETDTSIARNFLAAHPEWKEETSKGSILADISLWAQFYLLAQSGATTENTHTAINPDLNEKIVPNTRHYNVFS